MLYWKSIVIIQKGIKMAEEQITPKHQGLPELSRDDVSALGYVLAHVRGASPTSMSLIVANTEDASE